MTAFAYLHQPPISYGEDRMTSTGNVPAALRTVLALVADTVSGAEAAEDQMSGAHDSKTTSQPQRIP